MNKLITLGLIIGLSGCALLMPKEVAADNIDITGTVQSRCIVNTDTPGVYGNPNAYTLTTLPASNGQVPIVRIDVSLANAYNAIISYPTSFASSPKAILSGNFSHAFFKKFLSFIAALPKITFSAPESIYF